MRGRLTRLGLGLLSKQRIQTTQGSTRLAACATYLVKAHLAPESSRYLPAACAPTRDNRRAARRRGWTCPLDVLSPRPASVGTTSRRAQPPPRRTRAHLAKSAWGLPLSLCTRARCFRAIRPSMLIHADVAGRVADQARLSHSSCAGARRRHLVLLGAEAVELWRGVRAGGAALVDRHQRVPLRAVDPPPRCD